MHRITRKRLLVFTALVATMLLGIVWCFIWCHREPSYGGKTVTEWLDSLVLYTYEQRSDGVVARILRSAQDVVADPAFHALSAIGPRAAPVLEQRISEPAGFPPEMPRTERWSTRLRWKWYRLRGPTRATRPGSESWPPTQAARKTAAAFMLLALGTNGHGGFPRLMETYAAAPRFTSVYGGKITGAPVGFMPGEAVRLACAARPQLRDEFVSGVMAGLQHTNPLCQSMAVDCARVFPELRHRTN